MPLPFLTILKGVSAFAGLAGSLKKKQTGLDLAQLRRDAVANGFNPLTVLRTTGAQGYARANQPNPLLSIANFGADIAGVFESNQDRSQAKRESDARIGLMNSQVAAFDRPVPVAVSDIGVEPKTFDDWGFVDVFDAHGRELQLHGGIAERLGIFAGDVLLAEDFEAVSGEIGGELWGIGQMGQEIFGGKPDAWLRAVEAAQIPIPVVPPVTYKPLRFDITVPKSPTPNRRQPFAPLTR